MASPVRCERAIYCKMFQIIKKQLELSGMLIWQKQI